ncbi:hypothetical protein FRC18_011844 [Serendipita sp. 400]|nr:hypothetical protein FRC18_011844 [Serendipita sp. 400]
MNSGQRENFTEEEIQAGIERLIDARELLGPLSAARFELVDKLERIEESKLGPLMSECQRLVRVYAFSEEQCGICYNTFAAIIAEEEMLLANDTPVSERDLGVTKLQTCGHYFCRKDISKWILEGNDACPYCRIPLLPEGARNAAASALASAGINEEDVSSSLEEMMNHLQQRWDAAVPGNSRATQRPAFGSSGMYS